MRWVASGHPLFRAELNSEALRVAWSAPPRSLGGGSGEVHVWRAALDADSNYLEALRQTLAQDERDRAGRFHFAKDRDRFIAARGILRSILGRYLRRDPATLRFRYGDYGKPQIENASGLRFNLAHSGMLALCAVTWEAEVGVDVEEVRAGVSHEEIAERFFSPSEVAALRALPSALQQEAFFHCWTRKEAYIKAIGEGLSMPLDRFDVSLAPGEPARLLAARGEDPKEASRWSLCELSPGPGYVGALAVQGHAWQLETWTWPGP